MYVHYTVYVCCTYVHVCARWLVSCLYHLQIWRLKRKLYKVSAIHFLPMDAESLYKHACGNSEVKAAYISVKGYVTRNYLLILPPIMVDE